jgi:hypothetical protein
MSPRPVFIECDNDATLVRTLLRLADESLVHHDGRDAVLMNLRGQVAPVRALIDEDPDSIQPSYITSPNKVKVTEFLEHGLKLLQDRKLGHWVVVLCPRLEPWILTTAERAGIDTGDFDLPKSENLFKKAAKNKPVKFAQLIRKMASTPNIRLLKELLSESPS